MQDKKELEKFIKGFVLKTPQVIIQSRMGEKIQTSCSSSVSSSNWFNISIDDYPEVVEDTKRALNLVSGDSIVQRFPLTIEISLRTTEGDSMVLEVWSLGLTVDRCDATVRASHTIYNRMSILLKSLISVSRTTPAYKLSRRQSADSYQILYRIYVGDPEIHCLGDGHKQLRVGQLCTMVGTLSVSVSYRTKMTISPTQTIPGKDTGMMLKSDHFIKDLSPKQINWQNNNNNGNSKKTSEKKSVDLTKPMKMGAFVDCNRTRKYSEDDYILPETPPFSWLLRQKMPAESNNGSNDANNNQNHNNSSGEATIGGAEDAATCNKENESQSSSGTTNQNTGSGGGGVGVKRASCVGGDDAKVLPAALLNSQRPSRWSVSPTLLDEEKFLKELHFPFATSNTPIGDLAKFYRDCNQAPPLQGLAEDVLPEEDSEIDDLTQKLEDFETALPEFDSLVSSLYGQSFEEAFSH